MSERDCGIWNGVKFLVDDNGKRFEGTIGECLDQMAQLPGAANLEVKALPSFTHMVGGISMDVNVRPNVRAVNVIRGEQDEKTCRVCGMLDCLCDFGVSP